MKKPKTYVGGQAVIEGVMMRGPVSIATAVRTPSGEITVKKDAVHSITERYPILKKPFLRGVVLAIVFFLAIPTYAAKFIPGVADSAFRLNVVEGVLRLAIFLLYIWGISLTSDIRRVFEYHGAEHKTIWTYESGEELTVENVKRHSRLHPRCGTNFLLIVMVVSIFVFAFLGWPNLVERIASRVLLMPVVAGISYEMIRLAGRTQNPVIQALFRPGLWLQYLTTREPHADQIEVAIEALNAAKPADEENESNELK